MNSLSYSSADVFAAVAVDSQASKLVEIDDTAGAGEQTLYQAKLLSEAVSELFNLLPQGISITSALTRFYRIGWRVGAVVEGFGVRADIRYYATRTDIFQGDCDLFEFLADKLIKQSSEM